MKFTCAERTYLFFCQVVANAVLLCPAVSGSAWKILVPRAKHPLSRRAPVGLYAVLLPSARGVPSDELVRSTARVAGR